MKALQLFALVLALGLGTAFAQQEIAPENYDQPAVKASVQKASVQKKNNGSHLNAQRQHSHQTIAKVHRHHSRTAA